MTDHAILTVDAHRDLAIRTARGADLGDAVMACLAVPAEFRQVQNEYPILFRLNAERDGFTAVALFGFDTGENLFLGGGRWDARYRPLAMDIQPFLIGGTPDAEGAKQVHVDLTSPRIAAPGSEDAVRLFDLGGQPTPYLEWIAERLGALDEGYRSSAGFFAALRAHNLLEPLSLDVTLADGSTNRLVGFHVIDEDRVRALDAATLGELHAAGHLLPIFMALASLSNIAALVARKDRQAARG